MKNLNKDMAERLPQLQELIIRPGEEGGVLTHTEYELLDLNRKKIEKPSADRRSADRFFYDFKVPCCQDHFAKRGRAANVLRARPAMAVRTAYQPQTWQGATHESVS